MSEEADTTTTTVKKEEEVKEVKTETTDEGLTDEDKKAVDEVKGRLKFFFSDANVRQDNFIRNLLMENDEGELPNKVPVETLLRFNTIKVYTTNPSVIIKAAKELPDLLNLDDDERAIGRVVPFTESMMDDNIPNAKVLRSIQF